MLCVFIHCVDTAASKLIYEWIENHGYHVMSSPFGFSNDGILEMAKDDYLNMIERCSFMKAMMKFEYVKEIVIEEGL